MSTNKRREGILTVISGFSGAGKGTLVHALVNRYPSVYALSVSATTRKPRPGEQEGREYFFKTEAEFLRMVKNGEFIEHAAYVDHRYGTPEAYVRERLADGADVILEIEAQGALNIKEKHPDAFLLFVMPPDIDTLISRLRERASETEEIIKKRLETACKEADAISSYDFIVINDNLEQCVEHTHRLIQMQHDRPQRAAAWIQETKRELENKLKGE